jgi:hypothetical protein
MPGRPDPRGHGQTDAEGALDGMMKRNAHSPIAVIAALAVALTDAPAAHAIPTVNMTPGIDAVSRGIHALQMLIIANTNTPSAIGHTAGALALISVAGVFANVIWGTTRALLICMLCFAVNAMVWMLELGIDALLAASIR